MVLGVNAVLVALLATLGVPLVAGAESRGGAELMDFLDDEVGIDGGFQWTLFDSKAWLLVLLVPLAVALGTAVRRTLRRPGTTVSGNDLKVAAVCGAVAGLLAALLVRVSMSGSVSGEAALVGEASGSASADVGVSLLWAPLLGAAWAALAVWVLRWGPTLALSLPPRVTRLIAGREIAPEWAAALAGTAPAPAGTRSARVRLGALLTGVLLAVAAVAAAVIAAVNAFFFTPESAAERYLEALADRDVAGVLEQLSDAPDVEGQPLLTDEVLDSDDYSPIGDVEVRDVQEYGSSAQVTVRYTVDGQPMEESISLVQGEERFGVFRTWTVAETLPTLEPYSDSDLGAETAGVELDQSSHLALPGSYVLHAADHPLLTSGPTRFVVTMRQSSGAGLDPEVKPEALEDAQALIEERIAECTTMTSVPLTNCPFLSYWSSWSGELTDVGMTVTSEPEFSLEYEPYTGVLDIVTEERGELRLTGTTTRTDWLGELEVEAYEDEFWFDLSGEVTGSAGDLEVQFDE
ncbi:hypothetical protein [Modestobacter sp. SYSU DS0290]